MNFDFQGLLAGGGSPLARPQVSILWSLGAASLSAAAIGFVVGRRRGWPIVTVLPIFVATVTLLAVGIFALRRALLVPYLHVAAALAAPAELLFVAWVLYATLATTRSFARAPASGDFHERIQSAVGHAAGLGRFGAFLAGEISTLYYSLFSWRSRPTVASGQTAFAYRRTGGHGIAFPAIVVLILLETMVLHLLLSRFAPRLAAVVAALSAYAVLWVIADDRATTLRPIVLDGDTLHVRSGLRWTAHLPLATIDAVRPASDGAASRKSRDCKSLMLFGRPQVWVDLATPAVLEGMLGTTRAVRALGFSVDDWEAFRAALAERGIRVEGHPLNVPDDFHERLREGLRGALRNRAAADALAQELSLLACAFFFWCLTPEPSSAYRRTFSIHRKSGYGAVFAGLVGASLVEMAMVHLMLRGLHPSAATVLLVLGVYGLVWFMGDFQALRLRRTIVDKQGVRVRVGVRKEAIIPLEDVERIESSAATEPDRKSVGYMRCTALGPPELLIRLRRPVRVHLMLGRHKDVSCIGLTVDDETDFCKVVTDFRAGA